LKTEIALKRLLSLCISLKCSQLTLEQLRLLPILNGLVTRTARGQEINVFGVTHSKTRQDVTVAVVRDILIFMGGDNLKSVSEMNAGNIVGIGGLENVVLKMGTLSSCPECPSFAPAKLLGTGLIKVAVQPKNLSEMPILIEGLRKLDKADPSVSYHINEKGEYILQTCGQIHLERCVKDLKDDFAQIEIEISEPIITFKETVTLNNLRRESDFDVIEKDGEWFEIDEEAVEKRANDIVKNKGGKKTGKHRRDEDSDEEKKESEDEEEEKEVEKEKYAKKKIVFIKEEDKLDQTDMYIDRVM
jgi:translation elongation factor EF-G